MIPKIKSSKFTFGSVYPPNLLVIIPPTTTPNVGPVIDTAE